MKLFMKIILESMVLLAAPILAMDVPPQGVVIENSYGARIKVLWKTNDVKNRYEINNTAE